MGDFNYELEIRRSKNRKKTVSIRVEPNLVILNVPQDFTDKEAKELLEKKETWLNTQLKKTSLAFCPVSLAYGTKLPFLGSYVTLAPAISNTEEISLNQDILFVPKKLLNKEELYSWYRKQADIHLKERTSAISKTLGFTFNNIRIKDQKTRWGSCSSKNNINLSWRLVLLPQKVMDYVIIHELCHLQEMNHSDRFWSLVEQYCPDYKTSKKYLKKHSQKIQAFLS